MAIIRWKSGSFEYEYPSGIKTSTNHLIGESGMKPDHPGEVREDQEQGPGDAHPQQQDLAENQAGILPARCEDLTGNYAAMSAVRAK